MIQAAGKYSPARPVQTPRRRPAGGGRAPALFVPTIGGAAQRISLKDWYWKEIKEGGFLDTYLRQEKARLPSMLRNVMRVMQGFTQNPKSDLRRLCTVPARLYHRWKAEDEHFWEDDSNLRSMKRDNPDVQVYLGPRRLGAGGGKRFRKVYSSNKPKP